jgi:predicted hotdog family 3-hydroxylacyl-ACP dehydratase
VICRKSRLDDLEGDLIVVAERLMGEEGRVIYRFEVGVGELEVLRGRAAVVLDAGVS